MVATLNPREVDIEQPSHTEQLANWISRVRCKKIMCRRNRKRDLRVEAVLTNALCKAEYELRSKQLSRISRWRQMKKQFKELNGGFGSGSAAGGDYEDCRGERTRAANEDMDPWKGPLCPELSSLDSFMSKLNEIKRPLQR